MNRVRISTYYALECTIMMFCTIKKNWEFVSSTMIRVTDIIKYKFKNYIIYIFKNVITPGFNNDIVNIKLLGRITKSDIDMLYNSSIKWNNILWVFL